MDWNEAYLRLVGIWQSEAALRRAAFLIHRSLVEKPVNILEEWPLPLDEDPREETRRRMEAMKSQYLLLKQQLINKSNGRATA